MRSAPRAFVTFSMRPCGGLLLSKHTIQHRRFRFFFFLCYFRIFTRVLGHFPFNQHVPDPYASENRSACRTQLVYTAICNRIYTISLQNGWVHVKIQTTTIHSTVKGGEESVSKYIHTYVRVRIDSDSYGRYS